MSFQKIVLVLPCWLLIASACATASPSPGVTSAPQPATSPTPVSSTLTAIAPSPATPTETFVIPILAAIGSVVILPLIVDWIKRSWDYGTSIHKAKVNVLASLNDLIWNYHSECSRLYGLTYPTIINGCTDEEIEADIKTARPQFLGASHALYTGLFGYQSRIQQYYDNWEQANAEIDKLINWAFHDLKNAMDDHFILLMRKENYRDATFRQQSVKHLVRFRRSAESILTPLSKELRLSSSFWYPVRRFVTPKQKPR